MVRQRSARRTESVFVAEGPKVLGDALAAGASVESVFYAPDALGDPASMAVIKAALARGVRAFLLEPGVIERVADTVTPQGVLGVVGSVDCALGDLVATSLVLVLEDVRDPGNVGAIIRSADGAGIDGVICLAGTADIYNPKVVRATAGSIFHLQVVADADPVTTVDFLHGRGCSVLATVMEGGIDYAIDPWPSATALVLGNEANGVTMAMRERSDGTISIPIAGGAESLNVAMASTILCFEAARRRRSAPGS